MENKNIICFATLNAYSNKERQHHIMQYFSEKNKILWVNPMGNINHSPLSIFKKLINRRKAARTYTENSVESIENNNLVSKTIVIIPVHRFRIFRWINKLLLQYQISQLEKGYFKGKADILWTYYPSDVINDFAEEHKVRNGSKVVYDNVQRLKGVEGLPQYVLGFEKELYRICELSFCDSITIYNDVKNMGFNNIHRVPQGVNIQDFQIFDEDINNSKYLEVENEFKDIKTEIVGYIGGIHHSIDLDLVEYAAKHCPEKTFVLVGKIDVDISRFQNLHNVKFWGYRQYENLKYYINKYDICIIPYKVNQFTKGVYPTKMLEYVSMKKKIVSVDLPDIHDFKDYIYISKSYNEFVNYIKSSDYKSIDDNIIIENSWYSRIERIEEKLEETL
jgi:hypothetical protein